MTTKKDRYFHWRDKGADHEIACRRAHIANPDVRRQYRREWEEDAEDARQQAARALEDRLARGVAPADWQPRTACGRCGALECQCSRLPALTPTPPAQPETIPEPFAPTLAWAEQFLYGGVDATAADIEASLTNSTEEIPDHYAVHDYGPVQSQ